MTDDEVRPLTDYSCPELQELVSIAHKSWREETDVLKKKVKRKYIINLLKFYNKKVKFKAYKETL